MMIMIDRQFDDVTPTLIAKRPIPMPVQTFTLHRGRKLRGMGLPDHAHGEAQLTFAASGMVQVHTDEGRWLVPPHLAVWIPAGVLHRVEVLTDAELWMVHWTPSVAEALAAPVQLHRPFALRVTPLMRALLDAAFSAEIAPDKAELVTRLMLHELTEDGPCADLPAVARKSDRAARRRSRHRGPQEPVERRGAGVTRRDLRPQREPAVSSRDRADAEILAPARADRAGDEPAVGGGLDRPGLRRVRLRQYGLVLLCVPAGHRHDADDVPRRP